MRDWRHENLNKLPAKGRITIRKINGLQELANKTDAFKIGRFYRRIENKLYGHITVEGGHILYTPQKVLDLYPRWDLQPCETYKTYIYCKSDVIR